jgi:hypothetical protein
VVHLFLISSSPALTLMAVAALVRALARLLVSLAFVILVCKGKRSDLPAIAHELSRCFFRQGGSWHGPGGGRAA